MINTPERVKGSVEAPDKPTETYNSHSCMFLPRSLSSHRSTKTHSNDQPRPLSQPTATAGESAADEIPAEDPAILCALAFSDYELWSNPSLRDPNRDGCKFPYTHRK